MFFSVFLIDPAYQPVHHGSVAIHDAAVDGIFCVGPYQMAGVAQFVGAQLRGSGQKGVGAGFDAGADQAAEELSLFIQDRAGGGGAQVKNDGRQRVLMEHCGGIGDPVAAQGGRIVSRTGKGAGISLFTITGRI